MKKIYLAQVNSEFTRIMKPGMMPGFEINANSRNNRNSFDEGNDATLYALVKHMHESSFMIDAAKDKTEEAS